jgi:hypothetical protein
MSGNSAQDGVSAGIGGRMDVLRLSAGIGMVMLASACVPREQVTLQRAGDLSLVSTTAGNNLSVIRGEGAQATLCLRLGPDTASDRSGGAAGAFGNGSESGGFGASSTDVEVELIGRTPSIVLTRDTLFQLCLLHQNGLLSDADYVTLLQHYLDAGFDLAALETQNTEIQIGDPDNTIFPGFGTPAQPLATTPSTAPGPAPAPAPSAANPL